MRVIRELTSQITADGAHSFKLAVNRNRRKNNMPFQEISFFPEDTFLGTGVGDDTDKLPLKETNRKGDPHVPYKEKPPQVVARRNARERRRVHAVNMAFVRLRKMIPVRNSRGKRVSKVKTLHNAIKYIKELEMMLQREDYVESLIQERFLQCKCEDLLQNFDIDKF